ncbi:Uncharacterized protein DAT39_008993 [Clarias magur]|uniref:Uncharacterized protein n=1 Tax=Clarias magur TaxID=1594786 RepID=A0A8J4U6T7_CLAMG|nr:Uncharacterized protein DAT39_008993 [Clarias magur]
MHPALDRLEEQRSGILHTIFNSSFGDTWKEILAPRQIARLGRLNPGLGRVPAYKGAWHGAAR